MRHQTDKPQYGTAQPQAHRDMFSFATWQNW